MENKQILATPAQVETSNYLVDIKKYLKLVFTFVPSDLEIRELNPLNNPRMSVYPILLSSLSVLIYRKKYLLINTKFLIGFSLI